MWPTNVRRRLRRYVTSGDLLEKRRRLMEEWARYCATPAKAARSGARTAKIVPIGA
jgi:hypothetical protein